MAKFSFLRIKANPSRHLHYRSSSAAICRDVAWERYGLVVELLPHILPTLVHLKRLAVDPNSNNILFFGARSGNGLWKSTNFGQTWIKVASLPNAGQ